MSFFSSVDPILDKYEYKQLRCVPVCKIILIEYRCSLNEIVVF